MSQQIGRSFMDAEVVDLYLHRPPYSQRLYDLLVELAPGRENLLDLGCGHGKVSRPLSGSFETVTAVDPSARMIALGQSLSLGDAPNIDWVEGYAEEVPLARSFDVVVAALSIHWMDHARLFPRIAQHVTPDHLFAVVEGDGAHAPPWEGDWQDFLGRWVPELTGQPFVTDRSPAFWEAYQQYVDVGEVFELISDPFQQSVDDFILCQHSRDTFTISKLGARRSRFDDELRALLREHADHNGILTYRSMTKLTVAKIT